MKYKLMEIDFKTGNIKVLDNDYNDRFDIFIDKLWTKPFRKGTFIIEGGRAE